MAIPTTRDEAIDDGKLQQYAHLYDVADEGRQRVAADAVIDADLQAHKSALANRSPRKYGHLNGVVNNQVGMPGDLPVQSISDALWIENGRLVMEGVGDYTIGSSGVVVHPGVSYPGTGLAAPTKGKLDLKPATSSEIGGVKPSASITIDEDGTAKVSDDIFGEPLAAEDGKVTVKYDETLKVGDDGALGVVSEDLAYNPPLFKSLGHVRLAFNPTLVSSNNQLGVRSFNNSYADVADFNANVGTTHSYSSGSKAYTVYGTRLVGDVFKDGEDSLFVPRASANSLGTVKPGANMAVTDEGAISVDLSTLGPALAGDALYYDSADGLMVKVSDGLEIQNDSIAIDQDKLPLASTTNRGTVKVGSGLAIAADGTLSATGGSSAVSEGSIVAVYGTADDYLLSTYKLNRAELYAVGVVDFADYPDYKNGVLEAFNVVLDVSTSAAFAAGTTITVGISSNDIRGGGGTVGPINETPYCPLIQMLVWKPGGSGPEESEDVAMKSYTPGKTYEDASGNQHTYDEWVLSVKNDIAAQSRIYMHAY